MGVQRIPVGGVPPDKYVNGRDWHEPFRPYFCFEPTTLTRGRRTAVITGANYKAWDRALYLSGGAGANLVFEIGSSQLIGMHPLGDISSGFWDAPFKYYMTMNRSSGNVGLAAGDCCMGFGIGSMGKNTPWEGALPLTEVFVVHVRYNLVRQRWELFTASTADVGVSTPLAIQPNTDIDQRIAEFCMEWLPPYTLNVYCNEVKIHTQNLLTTFVNAGEAPFGQPEVETMLFVTNGSNAGFAHVEAGFYCPRFYQHIEYQPI